MATGIISDDDKNTSTNSTDIRGATRFTDDGLTFKRLPPIYGYHLEPLRSLREALEPITQKIDQLDKFIGIALKECHHPSEHGLTRDESASIYIYTMEFGDSSLYRILNEELLNEERCIMKPWYGYLKLFDTALQKLPNTSANLWRAIALDINYQPTTNSETTWWTITSCSTSLAIVQKFLRKGRSTLIMIEAKTGKNISIYSSFSKEMEVILGLGTRVRLSSQPLDHGLLKVVHFQEISDTAAVSSSGKVSHKGIKTYENGDIYDR